MQIEGTSETSSPLRTGEELALSVVKDFWTNSPSMSEFLVKDPLMLSVFMQDRITLQSIILSADKRRYFDPVDQMAEKFTYRGLFLGQIPIYIRFAYNNVMVIFGNAEFYGTVLAGLSLTVNTNAFLNHVPEFKGSNWSSICISPLKNRFYKEQLLAKALSVKLTRTGTHVDENGTQIVYDGSELITTHNQTYASRSFRVMLEKYINFIRDSPVFTFDSLALLMKMKDTTPDYRAKLIELLNDVMTYRTIYEQKMDADENLAKLCTDLGDIHQNLICFFGGLNEPQRMEGNQILHRFRNIVPKVLGMPPNPLAIACPVDEWESSTIELDYSE
jgi:hypothetical protein